MALAAGLAAAAQGVGRLAPTVGAPIIAVALGLATGPAVRRLGWPILPGVRFAGRYLLQAAIVALGTGLSIASVARTGLDSLPIMVGTFAACLCMAWLAGRLLRVDGEIGTLVTAGTGICGASAIAVLAPVISASEVAVAYALSTIVVFNLAAVLLFPAIGHLLGLSQHAFGTWAGTAVNDTSSVVAASYAYGPAAGDQAVVVKLTRTLLIVPMVVAFALRRRATAIPAPDPARVATSRGPAPSTRPSRWPTRFVPPFLLLFLLAAAANSAGMVPESWHSRIDTAVGFGIATAMAGIGLSTHPGDLRRAGLRPLLFGGVLSLTVAATGLVLQALPV